MPDRAADGNLGPLLAVPTVLVTMNSTVAIDALALDVPALVIGLPNNLSPFVEAGVMTGREPTAAEIRPALEGLLYDRKTRGALAAARRTFTARYAHQSRRRRRGAGRGSDRPRSPGR